MAAFDEARAAAEGVELIFPAEEVHDVAVCGMGGSAIAADLVLGAYRERLRKPMTVVRDYYLPGWIGENTLVILSSYSGGTEETLTCRLAGHGAQRPLRGHHERRQARHLLRRRGRAGRPGGARLQPRAALLRMLIPIAVRARPHGRRCRRSAADLDEARATLADAVATLGPEVPGGGEPGQAARPRAARAPSPCSGAPS